MTAQTPEKILERVTVQFPQGVYADCRLERVTRHHIIYRDGDIQDALTTTETGAFLRVLKDGRWYMASTTDLTTLDQQFAVLVASNALVAGEINGVEESLEAHQQKIRSFDRERIDTVSTADKLDFLRQLMVHIQHEKCKTWTLRWIDYHRDRRFLSSKGADISHDYQECGFIISFTMAHEQETIDESYRHGAHFFSELSAQMDYFVCGLQQHLDKCARFVSEAKPVEPGCYPVILAPGVAGVFAHESFGHKSEADFMLGDPAMLDEWEIGTTIGGEYLTIVDDGQRFGSGYCPFDDEGQPAQKTFLIQNGLLTGRLHSVSTAAALDEPLTGNARALSFRFEPIVRMTTTYIEPGQLSKEELFASIKDGFFIETFKQGSGMSTFTIAPSLAWHIRDGKIVEPARITIITGSVFQTLGEIDGLSDTLEILFFVGGGCGKFEQTPLPVGFGGPYVRVAQINVA